MADRDRLLSGWPEHLNQLLTTPTCMNTMTPEERNSMSHDRLYTRFIITCLPGGSRGSGGPMP